jgi:hypothetical protein
VFAHVDSRAIESYLDIWCVHLVSALSHTQLAIKTDALRLLEILLHHYPVILALPSREVSIRVALFPIISQHSILARGSRDACLLLVRVLNSYHDIIIIKKKNDIINNDHRESNGGAMNAPEVTLSFDVISTHSRLSISADNLSIDWSGVALPLIEIWMEAVAETNERSLSNVEASHLIGIAKLLRVTTLENVPQRKIADLLEKHVFNSFPLSIRCVGNAREVTNSINSSIAALMMAAGTLRADSLCMKVKLHLMNLLEDAQALGRLSDDAVAALIPVLELVNRFGMSLLCDTRLLSALHALASALRPLSPALGLMFPIVKKILVVC